MQTKYQGHLGLRPASAPNLINRPISLMQNQVKYLQIHGFAFTNKRIQNFCAIESIICNIDRKDILS